MCVGVGGGDGVWGALRHYHTRPPSSIRLRAKRPKNITRDELGVTHGTVHMQRQDFGSLNLKKSKATRAERGGARGAAAGGAEGDTGGGAEAMDEDGGDDEDEEPPVLEDLGRSVGKKHKARM